MILWSTWKGLGWGSIIYLAAISGIDQELFEAARVDGAGRFRLICFQIILSPLVLFDVQFTSISRVTLTRLFIIPTAVSFTCRTTGTP